MADQDFDLTESATPYKLEEARKKGTVAKSADFTAMVVLAAMVATVYASGWDAIKQSVQLQLNVLARLGSLNWNADGVATLIGQLAMGMLHILAPLFMAVAIAAVVANLFQTGPIFSANPISPDFDRISPATGFKRIFSMRTVYESFKSIFKLILLGSVAYVAIKGLMPGLIGLSALNPKEYPKILVILVGDVLVKLLFILLIVALIDLSFTRWEFAKRMRMSRRDVRDESKQREGDPRIRARIREIRKELLKRSKAMKKLPTADVLITNPTHLAVALSYKRGETSAPKLVAKGAGELARKMRLVANRHNIPIVQNKALARELFREVDYESFVPERMYPQLAKIMVWVHTIRQMRLRAAGAA